MSPFQNPCGASFLSRFPGALALTGVLCLMLAGCGPRSPRFTVQALQDYNAFQERSLGWTGADGAYSIALADQRTLWLYSDTWIGRIDRGRRVEGTLINNSVGIQTGRDPRSARMDFFWRDGVNDQPEAFIQPEDGVGWFWLQDGALIDQRLYFFLVQVVRTDETSVFGFETVGVWLARVDNPTSPPLEWRIQQTRLPFADFSDAGAIAFGASVLEDGGFLYVYGYRDTPHGDVMLRESVVARVARERPGDFGAWRFYRHGEWIGDFRQASGLFPDAATGFSVVRLEEQDRYVAIYTERGMSPRILARFAPSPAGPWSAPVLVHHCPESDWDPDYFCYAAKAHPALSPNPSRSLVITYVCNSMDFWKMVGDGRIYWPRFVRMDFAPPRSWSEALAF